MARDSASVQLNILRLYSAYVARITAALASFSISIRLVMDLGYAEESLGFDIELAQQFSEKKNIITSCNGYS